MRFNKMRSPDFESEPGDHETMSRFGWRPEIHAFMRGRRGFRHFQTGGSGVRSGRGNMKYEILSVLADQPRHGYDVMREIEERRGGMRPSPGSIYPALAMLQDGDFLTVSEVDGKRMYAITDTGRGLLAEHAARVGDVDEDGDEAMHALLGDAFKSMRGLMSAAKEVARSANPSALKRVVEVLDRARRDVYAILADEL